MNSKKKKTYIFEIIVCSFSAILLAVNFFTNSLPILIIPLVVAFIALIIVIICFIIECKTKK